MTFDGAAHPLAAASAVLLDPRYRAARASCLIFCLGFGALNAFSALGIGDARLPGLYSFRAATVGDGVLLPLLAYSLLRSADVNGRRSRYQIVFSRVGGALGALAGMSVEAYGLLDPDARLDWTFPAPHSYNIPGWYHAVFLMAASGFFGWALALVLAQIREESRASPALALDRVRSAGTLGVLAPGLAFLGLLEEDDLSGNPRIGLIVLVTMLAFGAVLCAALGWACGRPAIRWCVLAVLGALLPAIALCDLFLPGHAARVPSVLFSGAAGLGIVAISYLVMQRSRAVMERRGPAALTTLTALSACAVCAVGPLYALSTGRQVTVARLAAALTVSLLLACCELSILVSSAGLVSTSRRRARGPRRPAGRRRPT